MEALCSAGIRGQDSALLEVGSGLLTGGPFIHRYRKPAVRSARFLAYLIARITKSVRLIRMSPETRLEPVFFYGLFMDPEVLRRKGLEPREFTIASVEGYGLRIGERATLERSDGERVFGTVMRLSPEELDLLYSDESVADYVPVRLVADDMKGDRIGAISYILPMELLAGENAAYARALLSAAEKIGLPEAHLRTIASIV